MAQVVQALFLKRRVFVATLRVCVCVCVCVCICVHTYTHTYVCVCLCVDRCVNTYYVYRGCFVCCDLPFACAFHFNMIFVGQQ